MQFFYSFIFVFFCWAVFLLWTQVKCKFHHPKNYDKYISIVWILVCLFIRQKDNMCSTESQLSDVNVIMKSWAMVFKNAGLRNIPPNKAKISVQPTEHKNRSSVATVLHCNLLLHISVIYIQSHCSLDVCGTIDIAYIEQVGSLNWFDCTSSTSC